MRGISLALAIFCLAVAESRFQQFDRQWTEEDARQNCTTKCADECEYCKDPKYCNEDQFKCGEKAPEVGPDCPPDDVCVPSGCECKKIIVFGAILSLLKRILSAHVTQMIYQNSSPIFRSTNRNRR